MKKLPIIDLVAIGIILVLVVLRNTTLLNLAVGSYLIFAVYRNYPTLVATKGSKAYKAGNTDMAIIYFEKAVNHPFAKPFIKSSYGYVLLREGRLEEAEPYLVEATQEETKDKRLKYNNILNLSILHWKKGDVDEAIRLVEDIKEDYRNSIMYEILGYLYIAKGDYEKALSFNQEAYEFNQDDFVITDNLAQSHFFLKDYDEALKLYDLVIEEIKFPEAHYYYGLIQWHNENYLEAYHALEKATRLKVSFLSIVNKAMIDDKFSLLQEEMKTKGLDLEKMRALAEQETENLSETTKGIDGDPLDTLDSTTESLDETPDLEP